MSQFAEDVILSADFEIPCEFCSELYPFVLLMEHQLFCAENLQNLDDEVVPSDAATPTSTIASASPKASKVKKVEEAKQKSPDLPKAPTSSSISKENIVASSEKQNENKTFFDELLKDDDDDDDIPIIFEDDSEESGVKLMSYGSNVGKRTEEEKPSFRPPPLPLFDDLNETKETPNVISDDDDAGESLEDFWRRADIKNSQRLRKLKS